MIVHGVKEELVVVVVVVVVVVAGLVSVSLLILVFVFLCRAWRAFVLPRASER